MRELKKLDKVAYIRFASVYRNFEDGRIFPGRSAKSLPSSRGQASGLCRRRPRVRPARHCARPNRFVYHDPNPGSAAYSSGTGWWSAKAGTASPAKPMPNLALVEAGDQPLPGVRRPTSRWSHAVTTVRTPQCAEALVAAGVVPSGGRHGDPNPLVAGQGFAALRAAGLPSNAACSRARRGSSTSDSSRA